MNPLYELVKCYSYYLRGDIQMDNTAIVVELNQLLKGTHMGIGIFEDLEGKLQSERLKKEFHGLLDKLKMHAHSLNALIQTCGGDPVEIAGWKGMVTDAVEMLKNLMITSDKQVLEEAVKNMKMAQKALHAFDEKHLVLNDQMKKTMRIMQEDYESMYHMLHKYLIEFQ